MDIFHLHLTLPTISTGPIPVVLNKLQREKAIKILSLHPSFKGNTTFTFVYQKEIQTDNFDKLCLKELLLLAFLILKLYTSHMSDIHI